MYNKMYGYGRVKLSISRAHAAAGYFKISMEVLKGLAYVQQKDAWMWFYKAEGLFQGQRPVSHSINSKS
jgi:hypothetical protein